MKKKLIFLFFLTVYPSVSSTASIYTQIEEQINSGNHPIETWNPAYVKANKSLVEIQQEVQDDFNNFIQESFVTFAQEDSVIIEKGKKQKTNIYHISLLEKDFGFFFSDMDCHEKRNHVQDLVSHTTSTTRLYRGWGRLFILPSSQKITLSDLKNCSLKEWYCFYGYLSQLTYEISFENGEILITSLDIPGEHQNKLIGQLLVQKLINWAKITMPEMKFVGIEVGGDVAIKIVDELSFQLMRKRKNCCGERVNYIYEIQH